MKNISLIIGLLVVLCGCTLFKRQPEKEKVVRISTNYGDIRVKLYNETPLHRDNFIKLVEDGFYDSLLFHRVIYNFMIQGGDPESKNAPSGKKLGNGDVEYKLPAEIRPHLYHKKGALAAAREGDDVNPERKSSGCQFYIVQGNTFTQKELTNMQEKLIRLNKNKFVFEYINAEENKALKDSIEVAKKAQNQDKMIGFIQQAEAAIQPKLDALKFSEEKINTYTTIGGTPHLDHTYTVFGEVIEGLNIVDSIAQVVTDRRNRPKIDVVFSAKVEK